MTDLNGQTGQKEWEEYKEYLKTKFNFTTDRNPKVMKYVEQAFKIGFLVGKTSLENEDAQPEQEHGGEPENGKKTRRHKTYSEFRNDCDALVSLLKSTGRPMPMREIVYEMNKIGSNLSEKTSTAFLKRAMEIHPEINKVRNGLYEYLQPKRNSRQNVIDIFKDYGRSTGHEAR